MPVLTRLASLLAALCSVALLLCACEGGAGGPGGGGDATGGDASSGGGGDYLCGSHVTTDNRVVGNNVYEFVASPGQCFGTTADHGIAKQRVELLGAQSNTHEFAEGLAELEAQARVSSYAAELAGAGAMVVQVGFEVTNTHDRVICPELNGAVLLDAQGGELVEVEVDVLGDLYFGERASRLQFRNDCIAAGATRTVWGRRTANASDLPADGLASLARLRLDYRMVVPDPDDGAYFPQAMAPGEAAWTSAANGAGGLTTFEFLITHTFTNPSSEPLVLSSRRTALVYFDDEGFVVYASSSTIDDFLGIDDEDLVDADYRLDANGGTLGFADLYGAVLPSAGTVTISNRATRVVISLDGCSGVNTPAECGALR